MQNKLVFFNKLGHICMKNSFGLDLFSFVLLFKLSNHCKVLLYQEQVVQQLPNPRKTHVLPNQSLVITNSFFKDRLCCRFANVI